MSESGGAGRREVAYRIFAGEYDDATLQYSEDEEERAPNYVVTPTGARANRLFVVGVLTEIEQVSDDVLRGRIVDPTGAFVVYAGQYQPDPKTFLERAEPPAFVAVTGKARTFTPDGSDRVLTSVRPESINEVDADTRDRWVVGTAAHTVERAATFAEALERPERGDALRDALLEEGVDEGIAEGIPLAIDHYGTTEAYLAAVRDLAIQAAAVVAGERDEVEPLDLTPDEGGSTDADLTTADTDAVAAPSTGGTDVEPDAAVDASSDTEPAADATGGAVESSEEDAVDDAPDATEAASAGTDDEPATDDSDADESTPAAVGTDSEDAGAPSDATDDGVDALDEGQADASEPAAEGSTDEMYELDEEERERVTEEYGTEFTTGAEVDEPGEAGIETPGPDEAPAEESADEAPSDAEEPAEEARETEEEDEEPSESTADSTAEADAADSDEAAASDDEAPDVEDLDLEEVVVDTMDDLDDGDGAEREAVVAAVVDEYGADPGAVEDAIQDALMSGLCYEPGEDRLKAI